jgi:energy-converting hydrogenase Eha subunit G
MPLDERLGIDSLSANFYINSQRLSINSFSRHAGLDPASSIFWKHWIPAFAGMTKRHTEVNLRTDSG